MSDGRPVAVITGAARGVGAATARRLAAAGWCVGLVDRCADDPALRYPLASRADLDEVAAACGPDVVTHVADVRDPEGLDAAVASVADRFGGLDAAIAAAGAIGGGPMTWETSDELWDAMIDINLTGVWRFARAAVPHLLARPEPRRGRFVAVASAAGARGMPRLGAYVAAKHGVVGLVRAMAAEVGPHGVTANAVSPGSTRTTMLDASAAVYDLDDVEEFVQHQPVGRLLGPDEIAAAVVWLCAEEASGVNGTVLAVDGGMTAT
ncbi:MAG: mycofactocin-coupled SDR family oxidoreductase [Actinomycetota bacterium]|nr:mycofactocin-coupled SDR family oxidoreductase [Actinomycetota bacterium]